MPTVAELIADRAEMDVVCELGSIRVAYRPTVITPKWQRDIGQKEDSGADETETLFRPLQDTIIAWDLNVSGDTPYGLDNESLATIPRSILNQILWSLMTTARPNQSRPPVLSPDGSPVQLMSAKKPASPSKPVPTGSA